MHNAEKQSINNLNGNENLHDGKLFVESLIIMQLLAQCDG
jgi:hypothetical protein